MGEKKKSKKVKAEEEEEIFEPAMAERKSSKKSKAAAEEDEKASKAKRKSADKDAAEAVEKSKKSKKAKKEKKSKEEKADTDDSAASDNEAKAEDAPKKKSKKSKKAERVEEPSEEVAAEASEQADDDDEQRHLAAQGDGSRSVYISGLPFDFKRKDIEGIFEKVGAMVTYIHMPVFEDSKRSRGFATVTFTKSEYVPLALELDGSKLKGGRWLKVAPLIKSKVKKNKGAKKKGAKAAEEGAEETPASTRKRRYTERPEGCNKVFVANIPHDAKETELRDLFSRCGTITHITMGRDRYTGKFSGSAWIEFEPNPEDEPSEKACSISGKVRIHANKLFIDYAPDSVVCFRCKSKDHLSRDCPRRQVHQNKRQKLDE